MRTAFALKRAIRIAAAFGFSAMAQHAAAQNLHLGDLDDDGVVTVRDLALLNDHISGAPSLLASPGPFDASHAVLADMNKDGAINSADRDELIKEILQTRTPETLPLGTVRFTSPASGEGDVALTRETILHFTVPLSLTATLDTTQFYAEFAGQRPLSRVEISSDRKKATLFYQQPLPANSRLKVTFDGSTLTDLIGRPFDAEPFRPRIRRISTNKVNPATGSAIRAYSFHSWCEALCTSPLSAWLAGDDDPSVGKQWEAIAGKADNLVSGTGTIYLPCVCAGTLKPVSTVPETKITFPPQVLAANPQLAGTEFTVPANTLFSDDGLCGGKRRTSPRHYDPFFSYNSEHLT